LDALSAALTRTDGDLGLPLIRNAKTVDPSDPASAKVIQIESAMGAAIETFAGAQSVEVGRDRFVPVKTTNDLLVLRSDVYELDEDFRLITSGARRGQDDPLVDLDPAYFKLVPGFERRFANGAPSLIDSDRLIVKGDVTFGAGVKVMGSAAVTAAEPITIPDGTVLD